jgi:NADPH:quinone reductase-like Zn-dependent oxidoreductase
MSATCICGSDLWASRGIEPADDQVMGHEYVGIVEEVGSAVRNVKVGDFVVGRPDALRHELWLQGVERAPRRQGPVDGIAKQTWRTGTTIGSMRPAERGTSAERT